MELVRALAAPPRVVTCVYRLREVSAQDRLCAAVQQDQKALKTSRKGRSARRSRGLRANESGRERNSHSQRRWPPRGLAALNSQPRKLARPGRFFRGRRPRPKLATRSAPAAPSSETRTRLRRRGTRVTVFQWSGCFRISGERLLRAARGPGRRRIARARQFDSIGGRLELGGVVREPVRARARSRARG